MFYDADSRINFLIDGLWLVRAHGLDVYWGFS